MPLKQQSAIEFITTYSFAIFMISLILVAAVSVSLSLGSTPPVASTCSIQPLIPCQQTLLSYNSVGSYFTFIVMFRNNLGYLLQFPANAINLTVTGLATGASQLTPGTCYPKIAGQGSQVLCKIKISGASQVKQGSNVYTQFHIFFGLCSNSIASSCSSNTYNATGFSYQSLSGPYSNLYNLTISVPGQNGIVLINGQSYFDGSVVYLIGGTYTLYPQPNNNYHFVSWSNTIVPISSTTQPNAILTMNNNGNVISNFVHN
jgi:hypothetical protein